MPARLAAAVLPAVLGTRGHARLAILIYHRVLDRADFMRPGEPTVAEFDWQMGLLRRCFNPLPLVEAAERLRDGSLPERAVCVTFDDGYADNAIHALPVLRKHAVPATVFISTGYLNGGRMWNDSVIETVRNHGDSEWDLRHLGLGVNPLGSPGERRAAAEKILLAIKHREPAERQSIVDQLSAGAAALPGDLMLSDEQVRDLAAGGVSIGAHTVSHPILASIPDDQALREIDQSRQRLQDLLQSPVESFAYPNGQPGRDYRDGHRDMVSNLGFRVAVSTHRGVGTTASDLLQLPRFTPWDRQETRFAVRLLLDYRRLDRLAGAA